MKPRHILIGVGGSIAAGAGAAHAGRRQRGTMSDYEAEAALSRDALGERPEARDPVRDATLAANGHDTQSWLFKAGDDRFEVLPDFSRRTPVVDPDDHHLFASLGCAAENLKIAAGARGRPGQPPGNSSKGGSATFAFVWST